MLTKLLDTLNLKKHYPFELQWAYKENEEFLALVFADEPSLGYYYAHIRKHPKKSGFVSYLVYTDKFITAQNVELWFKRFNYWIFTRLEFEPVTNDVVQYAYAETNSINDAMCELEKMVSQFSYLAAQSSCEDVMLANPQLISLIELPNFLEFSTNQDKELCYPLPIISLSNYH